MLGHVLKRHFYPSKAVVPWPSLPSHAPNEVPGAIATDTESFRQLGIGHGLCVRHDPPTRRGLVAPLRGELVPQWTPPTEVYRDWLTTSYDVDRAEMESFGPLALRRTAPISGKGRKFAADCSCDRCPAGSGRDRGAGQLGEPIGSGIVAPRIVAEGSAGTETRLTSSKVQAIATRSRMPVTGSTCSVHGRPGSRR